jgi:class 3 adenylate cyclase
LGETSKRTLTLLFADIEGSTLLVRELGEQAYGEALAGHRAGLRAALSERGGTEVDCRADEWFAVFESARTAVETALAAQQQLQEQERRSGVRWRVRMGLHAGEPTVEGEGYVGLDVNRTARICSAGHGGQVLVSRTVRDLAGDRFEFFDLGDYSLAGIDLPERIFQLVDPLTTTDFPPLRVPAAVAGRRRPGRLRRASAEPTLETAAWQVRSLLPSLDPHRRRACADLGASLFAGARAAERAERLLDRIDRDRLARRLAHHQGLAVFSEPAQRETDHIRDQIAAIEQLGRRRDAVAGCAEPVLDLTGARQPSLNALEALHQRVATATAALDDTSTRAAAVLSPASFKLKRTRHRGIFGSGGRYLVPYRDDAGTEQVGDFGTLAEAKAFRPQARAAEKMHRLASRSAFVEAERLANKRGRG